MSDSLDVQLARVQVLLEEQEKADKRHEAEMAVLETKINACFKRVDNLTLGLTEIKGSLDVLLEGQGNKQKRNWAVYMVIVGLVGERVVSMVIGG